MTSLTDSVGELSAREGLEKVEEIKVETVKVWSPKDNFVSPTDSEGATGREEPVSDSDEDGSDPEDSGLEEAISDRASAGSPGKGELKIGEIAGDSRGNGSETCDGGNQEILVDSAPFQTCICSGIDDPKGPLDLSLKEKQIGAKHEGTDRAHHVLDNLPKPSSGLAVPEIDEGFANKLLDLGTNVGHLSSSQSVECGRRLQSGVCKEPLGSSHHVFDFLPQGNAEGKGQVRAAVSSPRTWANIVASD
ncbi:hypothetical protein U1Q18_045599, partial [Sarracenia purpurea var. burkii]